MFKKLPKYDHSGFFLPYREQVRVNGFGIFFMVIYPGAFVDLYTEHLAVISPIRQLRIYCAGVWHNFILVLIALGFLWILPSVLSLCYVSERGAVILDLVKVRLDSVSLLELLLLQCTVVNSLGLIELSSINKVSLV